jgi:hypothetical protein
VEGGVMEGKSSRRDKLVWALAILNAVTLGALLIAPVGAHINNNVDHVWNHLKPRVQKLTGWVGFADIDDQFVSGGNGLKAFTDAKAPKSGFLVITGNIDSSAAVATDDTYECVLYVDDDQEREIRVEVNDGDNDEEDCTITATVPVDKGIHEVELKVENMDAETETDTFIRSANLWALFVPNDGRNF